MGETVKRTVHFTLGEGAGKLLTDIAREKIIYSLMPNEGLATIQESLIGCPKNIALDIIKGKLVLKTAEDNVSVISWRSATRKWMLSSGWLMPTLRTYQRDS